jgi:hypothetical protein
MKHLRRTFLKLGAAGAVLPALRHPAAAQAYPARPIRLVVPFPWRRVRRRGRPIGLFHRLPVGAPQGGVGPHACPGTDRGSASANFVELPRCRNGPCTERAVKVAVPR